MQFTIAQKEILNLYFYNVPPQLGIKLMRQAST